MAVHHTCDGCDQRIRGEPQKRGLVLQCDYCERCAGIYTAYQKEVDALHERIALLWTEELATLRATFREQLAKLPDDNAVRQVDGE